MAKTPAKQRIPRDSATSLNPLLKTKTGRPRKKVSSKTRGSTGGTQSIDIIDPNEELRKKRRGKCPITAEIARLYAYEYVCNGYDDRAAAAIVWPQLSYNARVARAEEALQLPEVKKIVALITNEQSRARGATAERVLEELSILALSDVRNYLEWSETKPDDPHAAGSTQVRIKTSAEIGDPARAIKTVRVYEREGRDGTTSRRIDFDLHGKERSLEILAKHHGLIVDRANVAVTGAVAHTVSPIDLSKLSAEELDALETLLEKTAPATEADDAD